MQPRSLPRTTRVFGAMSCRSHMKATSLRLWKWLDVC